jgi:hypothetical protein
MVELGVLRLQASNQQTQNDKVTDQEEEEDHLIADSMKMYPARYI